MKGNSWFKLINDVWVLIIKWRTDERQINEEMISGDRMLLFVSFVDINVKWLTWRQIGKFEGIFIFDRLIRTRSTRS